MTKTQRFDFKFCNDADGFSAQIIPTIATGIFNGAAVERVKTRYRDLAKNFDLPFDNWKFEEGLPYNQYKDLCIPLHQINDPTILNHTNVGVDLPVWFNFAIENKKVMLVAMEPLRKDDVTVPGYATLGSPFALASLKLQNKISWSIIYNFILQLIESDHSVYVTDIGKIYSLKNGRKYSGDPSLNESVFREELRHFAPDFVLTFGKRVFENTLQLVHAVAPDLSERVISLTHPAAFKGNKKYYEVFRNAVPKEVSLGALVDAPSTF